MPPITLNGDTGIQTPMYNGTITANAVTPSVNMKNRIINGAMVIDQRNAGASVTPNNSYTLDRWQFVNAQTGKVTIQQNAGSVTPPVGFSNYLGITSTSAYSVGTNDYFFLWQGIEGYNVADLNWGTANAKTVTISFWARSSLTGTFGGFLENESVNRSYVFSYTISAANTWEYKTVTIAGDTTGTWNTTNANGIKVNFSVGSGSGVNGSAGSWGSTRYLGLTGSTSVVGTNGATLFLTGVQLEVGSTATSFDTRSYGTELALAQRYYWETSKGLGGSVAASTTAVLVGRNPVTMRATPTTAGNAIEIFQLTVAGSKTQSSFSANISIGDSNGFALECANFTGLTQYYPVGMNSGKITFSSEL